MQNFSYIESDYSIRNDIPAAHRQIWEMLATPGCWWSGEERIAIASEVRVARDCEMCARRKEALSPFSLKGPHQTNSKLPEMAIDAVHRLVTDPSRLTRTWLEETELPHPHYVELLGIVVAVVSIDGFHRALGMNLEELPSPKPGQPSGYVPAGTSRSGAWVPTIQPKDVAEPESDLYDGQPQTGNVISAMSLVPDSVRMLRILSAAHYLEMLQVRDVTANGGRALSRPQIELLAGRVSAISECFY